MKHVPYGSLVGSLFGSRLLRSSQVCASIFLFPAKDEMGESESDGEDDLRVSSVAPNSAFLPGDPVIEAAHTPSSDT